MRALQIVKARVALESHQIRSVDDLPKHLINQSVELDLVSVTKFSKRVEYFDVVSRHYRVVVYQSFKDDELFVYAGSIGGETSSAESLGRFPISQASLLKAVGKHVHEVFDHVPATGWTAK